MFSRHALLLFLTGLALAAALLLPSAASIRSPAGPTNGEKRVRELDEQMQEALLHAQIQLLVTQAQIDELRGKEAKQQWLLRVLLEAVEDPDSRIREDAVVTLGSLARDQRT